jgi:glycosyltransferase involved in cell wall biosynthesis
VPFLKSPPLVTLVVLCHNQIQLTLDAIDSIIGSFFFSLLSNIRENVVPDEVPFEIVLVDDHSTDETTNIEHMLTGNIKVYHMPGLSELPSCFNLFRFTIR